MSDKFRAFIAVPLSKSVQKAIVPIQEQLQELPVDVKWVKISQMHLTLKFIGDIDTETAKTISAMMKAKLARAKAFDSEFGEPGAFPNTRHPEILWIGLKDPLGQLKNLADIVWHELHMLGFPKESRPFQAHITIGRVRTNKNIQILSEALLKIKAPIGIRCPISNVTLYKSILTDNGPIHDKMAHVDLISAD